MHRRDITDTMREIRKGRLIDLATRDLADVTQAVVSTGKPGSVTITIKVEPNKGAEDQVILKGSSKKTEPREDIPTAVFFTDNSGGLFRIDPKQREMDLPSGNVARIGSTPPTLEGEVS